MGIIYVMFSGAKRLGVRQNKNYGKDPEYQKYVKTVPILLPFVPLYNVEKYKWLAGTALLYKNIISFQGNSP